LEGPNRDGGHAWRFPNAIEIFTHSLILIKL
jgi:hypothetical protein